jgi:hypothetical protein
MFSSTFRSRCARLSGPLTAIAIVAACGSGQSPPPPAAAATAPPPAPAAPAVAPVQTEMANVRLHVDDGIVLAVRRLRGEMVSRVPGQPFVFDDPRSYILQVFTADIGMDMPSLAVLMNRHVFGYQDAPLKDLTVEIDEGRLQQKGKLRKGVWLPFSMTATASATDDGRLRLHTESVSALGIPATKLLDIFGLSVEDLVRIEKQRGVEIRDDDIIITAGQVLPPPEIRGNLSRVEVAGGELRLTFSIADGRTVSDLTPPDKQVRNFVYFSGSILRFGKLTMTGADLQLIDLDARDPFDFYPVRYNAQLVAGYSKNTPEQGLKTYMPDFDDLPRVGDMKPATARDAKTR